MNDAVALSAAIAGTAEWEPGAGAVGAPSLWYARSTPRATPSHEGTLPFAIQLSDRPRSPNTKPEQHARGRTWSCQASHQDYCSIHRAFDPKMC